MGGFDWLMGGKDTTASAGVWPFFTGTGGRNNFGAFNRQYAPPAGYNPALAPFISGGGMPAPAYMTGAPTGVAPTGAAPGITAYDPNAGGATGGVPASPQSGGGMNNLGQYYYDYQKNNSIPVAPTKGSEIPGVFPSAANEFLNGPPGYYPWMDVAGKSQNQALADQALLMGIMSNPVGAQRDIASELASGAPTSAANAFLAQMQGATTDPSFAGGVGSYGLQDFIGAYSANPYLNQQIGMLGNDAVRYLQESVLPEDRANAINAGQYGGSRSGIAEGVSTGKVGEEYLQQAGNMRYSDYARYMADKLAAGQTLSQNDINAQQAAIGRYNAASGYNLGLGGLMNQGAQNDIESLLQAAGIGRDATNQALDINNLLYGRGAADQALMQQFLNSDKARWDTGQTAPADWTNWYASILAGAPATPAPITDTSAGLLDYGIALASALNSGGGGAGVTRKTSTYGS